MPVQLPYSHSASVVLGSAMLGAAAAQEAARLGEGKKITEQKQAEESSYGMKERLWDAMVRFRFPFLSSPSRTSPETRG